MNEQPPHSGLEAAFLANRDKLLHFLRARGAGDACEDIVQEVWVKISTSTPGPVSSPLSYLMRMADMLMIDRYRSQRQAGKRERDWTDVTRSDAGTSDEPSAERQLAAVQEARQVLAMLDGLGTRVSHTFRLHRVEGIAQKAVARQLGVSLSTVESDLRTAYRALLVWKEQRDEV